MKLLRSWPAEIPEGRSYVVDGIDRLVMTGYDYCCLADVDDDVLLLEWDIAIGGEELAEFLRRAAAEPDRVRVAPYLLYPARDERRRGVQVHRVRVGYQNRLATPDDEVCHIFGFGAVYLPRELVRAFTTPATLKRYRRFTDATFSEWHYRTTHRGVPIDWDCPAVHLHYALPDVPAKGVTNE